MKKKGLYVWGSVFVILLVLLEGSVFSQAASMGKKARVMVESFSVSNDAIVPGEAFELTLKVKNTSDTDTAKSILMTFTNDLETVYTVYGEPDQCYIPELSPNGTKEITIKMMAAENLTDTSVKFKADFVYEDYIISQNTNSTTIQLPVTTTSKFEVQNVSFPDAVHAGEKTRMRITYKNTGADDFYNITMRVSSEETEETEQYSLGSLVAGKVSYAEMYVTLPEPGEQKVTISFSYEDIEGNKFNTSQYEQTVDVAESQTGSQDDTKEETMMVSKSYDLYFLILGVFAMAIVMYVLYKRYER